MFRIVGVCAGSGMLLCHVTGCGSSRQTKVHDSASITSPTGQVPTNMVTESPLVMHTPVLSTESNTESGGMKETAVPEISAPVTSEAVVSVPTTVPTAADTELKPLQPVSPSSTVDAASAVNPAQHTSEIKPQAADVPHPPKIENAPEVAAAASASSESPGERLDKLEQLAQLMCGEFNSAEQAARDPDYRDISLKTARIWSGSDDGVWLYVEQAVASLADRPYRQRIYHLTRVPKASVPTFRSDVFTIPGDAKQFVGAWKAPQRFDTLPIASLVKRDGCAVILVETAPGVFRGSTIDRECQSEFQKASYATSEVTIDQSGVLSWDRGFDREGKQVWGAVNGGYRFLRLAGGKPALAVPEK